MKLGLMQPYFFPYLGYFDLIYQSDRFIIFDTAQYIRRGWVNRNRVLHQQQGWQYITVPVKKHSRSMPIQAIEITSDDAWKEKILGQLQHYKRRAPFFHEVIDLVQEGISSKEISLSRLNVTCLALACDYLDIPFDYVYFSEMDVELGPIEGPGDWALRLSEALGADEYVNPPGGVDIYDPDRFREHDIKLTLRNLPPLTYDCDGYEFIPNLSIIDVLMWNEPERVREHLESHQ